MLFLCSSFLFSFFSFFRLFKLFPVCWVERNWNLHISNRISKARRSTYRYSGVGVGYLFNNIMKLDDADKTFHTGIRYDLISLHHGVVAKT